LASSLRDLAPPAFVERVSPPVDVVVPPIPARSIPNGSVRSASTKKGFQHVLEPLELVGSGGRI
jgi:hypothetical protein